MAIVFLMLGDPVWLIAAANLAYLIGIAMPSVAVYLLRHNEPDLPRPFRAPRGAIALGVGAAIMWLLTVVFGFQQFGLPTVVIGISFACSGSLLYAWRKFSDRRQRGLPGVAQTLHIKLTGAMLLVLMFDAAGYLIAVAHVASTDRALVTVLEDIFVVVALLTIAVGLVLPGMIAHSAVQVSAATAQLVSGTLADFIRAMRALAAGDLESAKARLEFKPVTVYSHDEVGDMARNFNRLQEQIGQAAVALDGARAGLVQSRTEIGYTHQRLQVAAATADAALKELASQKLALDRHAIVGVTDLQGRITYANDRFCKISQYTRAELLGQDHRILNSGYHSKEFFREFWQTITSGNVWHGELRNRAKDGSHYWVDTTVMPFLSATGRPEQYVSIRTDITDRKLAEQVLIAASRAKNEFLASMSHELRTPLNAILGFSQLFGMDPELSADLKAQAQEIESAGRHLLSLVNDVIDLARIESGQLDFAQEPVAVDEVFVDSLSIVAPLARKFAIGIRRDGAPGTGSAGAGLMIRADRVRFQQVIINLLSNGIKYNHPQGSVILSCAVSAERLRIGVTDTGLGIPAEKQANLFSAFNRLGREAGTIEGTGIGLVITKQLVEAMGGQIGFTSSSGAGSTFWVEFPLCAPSAGPPVQKAADPAAALAPVRPIVLYIEDNSMNVLLVRQIFKLRKEFDLRHTVSAEDGIAMARADLPALILMDINLQGMDGYAALSALKTDATTAHIPVIAITANAMKGERDKGLALGFAELHHQTDRCRRAVAGHRSVSLTRTA